MFSGIVEEMGSVASLATNDKATLWDGSVGEAVELTVKAKTVLEGATEGCSIAVNGVCLTVTSFDGEEFKVGEWSSRAYHFHFVPEYKERLYIYASSKRCLYYGTERFSPLRLTHTVRDEEVCP